MRDLGRIAELRVQRGCHILEMGTEKKEIAGEREREREVNLHILERAGFFIKKGLKLIYACVLLTHCTL